MKADKKRRVKTKVRKVLKKRIMKESLKQFLPPVSRVNFGPPSVWQVTLEENHRSTATTGTVRKSA